MLLFVLCLCVSREVQTLSPEAQKRGTHWGGFTMTKHPRKQSNSPDSHSEPADSPSGVGSKAGGTSGVALKKQIGLVSACGIIVGKSSLASKNTAV